MERDSVEDQVGDRRNAGGFGFSDAVCRPEELERHIAGISAKVLAERLWKLGRTG